MIMNLSKLHFSDDRSNGSFNKDERKEKVFISGLN